jgi:hypothetical protein
MYLAPYLSFAIDRATRSKRYNAGIKAMRSRPEMFDTELQMNLAGIAAVPDARAMVDETIDRLLLGAILPPRYDAPVAGEVIIGGGFHAAVYCAARVAAGFRPPTVLERGPTIGGAFGMSRNPSFYLNSYNRPAMIGLPSKGDARDGDGLNYLPGAPIQPAYLSGDEFQTNADMAWVIRVTLAMYANIYVNSAVADIDGGFDGRPIKMRTASGLEISAERVIDARGMGNPRTADFFTDDGTRVMTFPQFMARADGPFPLRGMSRVAVIGGGDSGKCAAEALLGIAPRLGMNSAAMDSVKSVDLYSTGLSADTATWRARERGRYQRLGSYLPRLVNDRFGAPTLPRTPARLRVIPETGEVLRSAGTVLVNGQTYDHVILATGSELPSIYSDSLTRTGTRAYQLAAKSFDREIYQVGPCADIPFSPAERDGGVSGISANRVAMFRLAPRTAALATMLPDTRVL